MYRHRDGAVLSLSLDDGIQPLGPHLQIEECVCIQQLDDDSIDERDAAKRLGGE